MIIFDVGWLARLQNLVVTSKTDVNSNGDNNAANSEAHLERLSSSSLVLGGALACLITSGTFYLFDKEDWGKSAYILSLMFGFAGLIRWCLLKRDMQKAAREDRAAEDFQPGVGSGQDAIPARVRKATGKDFPLRPADDISFKDRVREARRDPPTEK